MPIEELNKNLEEELNWFGARVVNRVRRNFIALDINRRKEGKGSQYTGNLYRSIYWTVHTMSGGNQAVIDFFYLTYGQFVEMGVGNGEKYRPLPEMARLEALTRAGSKRKAKPFMRSEIRLHARWLKDRLFDKYRFAGSYYMVKGYSDGSGDRDSLLQWISDNRDEIMKAGLFFIPE